MLNGPQQAGFGDFRCKFSIFVRCRVDNRVGFLKMAPKRAHHCGILRFLQANDIRLASHSGGNANRSEPQAQNAHIEFLYLFDQQGTTVRPLQLFKSTIACVFAGKAQQRDMLINKGLQLEKATTTPRSSKLLLLTARLATLVRVCNKLRAAMLRRHGKLAHLLKAKRGPSPRMLYDATRSSARLGSTTGGRANLTDLRCHHHQTNGAATATAIGRMKAAGSMELFLWWIRFSVASPLALQFAHGGQLL
jgi:hypothetical protein